jgi:hypothetical protein
VIRRLVARTGAVVGIAVAVGTGLAGIPGTPVQPICADAGSSHAALVVQHGDGGSRAMCVAFGGGTINGEDLLRNSGIQFSAVYYPGVGGDAICQIDGEPTTPQGGWNNNNCLGSGAYWGLYTAHYGGGWTSSPTGVSDISLGDGDAEGFHYARSGNSPPPSPTTAGCPPPQPPANNPPGGAGGGNGSGGIGGSGSANGSAPSGARGPDASPGEATTASPSDSSASASPTPDALAVGTKAPPSAPQRSAAPGLSARSPDLTGIVAAGVAGAGLFGLIAVQLILPRLRP